MSHTSEFDVATAALEHLELLNRSNQNPLEVAAQFRTLLRSKKAHSPNTDYTYTDYISADATLRRVGRFYRLANPRSKSLGKIQYKLEEDQSLPDSCSSSVLSKCPNIISSTEDMYLDSGISSDFSDLTRVHKGSKQNSSPNQHQYPTINWKQIREQQNEQKLSRVNEFVSTAFRTNRLPQTETTNWALSSLAKNSSRIDSLKYSNPFKLRKTFDENISIDYSLSRSRSTSSTTSIRTPSTSPVNCPRPTYTISRFDSTSTYDNDDDILVPIADCNLMIKHKVNHNRTKRLSHFENFYRNDELFRGHSEETIYF